MKRITLLYALAATLMVCSGCSDFLEEHNRSAVTTEGGYYDTEKGFESLINSCYTPLRFWGGSLLLWHSVKRERIYWLRAAVVIIPPLFLIRMILMGPILSVKSIIDRFYKAINFCNTAIYHVKNVPFSDKALTSKREAEVRFLRAYYYWILVETFGDTYYTDQPSESIVMAPRKTSVSEIYTHIFVRFGFLYG